MKTNTVHSAARRRFLSWLAAATLAPALAGGSALAARKPTAPTELKTLDGAKAPALVLEDLNGREYRLADQRGKITLVNFWGYWCPPCLHEMPIFQRTWETLGADGVDVWAVHIGGPKEEVEHFVDENGLTFPILMDMTGREMKAWPVIGLPATVVVDGQGRMQLAAIGAREWDNPEIINRLKALSR